MTHNGSHVSRAIFDALTMTLQSQVCVRRVFPSGFKLNQSFEIDGHNKIPPPLFLTLSLPLCLQGCLHPRWWLPVLPWSHGLELRVVPTVPRSSDGFSTTRGQTAESMCDNQRKVKVHVGSKSSISVTTSPAPSFRGGWLWLLSLTFWKVPRSTC